MYGEKRERVEDMFTTRMETEEEARKQKRQRKSESASTSPEHRRERDYVLPHLRGGQEDNMDTDRDDREDINKMNQTNQAFLKYLQLKVWIVCNINKS